MTLFLHLQRKARETGCRLTRTAPGHVVKAPYYVHLKNSSRRHAAFNLKEVAEILEGEGRK